MYKKNFQNNILACLCGMIIKSMRDSGSILEWEFIFLDEKSFH